jgi:hypothetical protein
LLLNPPLQMSVGAGFTNNNCHKSTISKTRPLYLILILKIRATVAVGCVAINNLKGQRQSMSDAPYFQGERQLSPTLMIVASLWRIGIKRVS